MNQAALELLIQLKDEASQGIAGIGSSLSSLGGMAVAGVAVAGAAIGGFLISAVGEAAEAEAGLAQLNAVIASTQGAAGMTADAVTDLASALQRTTKFSDDSIVAAESILLTFTGIGKEVFPDVTKVALDMSTALGTDLSGAAMQLGKALNDPEKGMTALTRSGVTFTDAQKETIKSLQATGDIAGAQKIILAELAKEFGGSAEAAGKTFSGQLEIAKNTLGEFSEMVGGRILPILTPLIARFIEFATAALPQVEAALNTVLPLIGDAFGNAISFIVGLLPTIGTAMTGAGNTIGAVVPVIVGFFTTTLIPALMQVVSFVAANWPTISATISAVINVIVTTILPALIAGFNGLVSLVGVVVTAFVANWPMIQAAIQTVINVIVTTILPALISGFNAIVSVVSVVVAAFVANWPMIQAAIQSAITVITTTVLPILMASLTALIDFMTQIVDWVVVNWPLIQATVTRVMQAISTVIQVVLPIIQAIFQTVFPIIRSIVEIAITAVGAIITAVMQVITGDTQGALETIRAAWASIWSRIQAALAGVIAQIKSIISTGMAQVKAEIVRVLSEALDFAAGLPAKFLVVGADIVKGLWNGIQGMGAWFKGVFAAWIKNMIPDWASKALGMGSPSKVMADQVGVPIVQGIIAGIMDQAAPLKSAMSQIAGQVAGTNMATSGFGAGRFGANADGLTPSFAGGSVVINIYADVANGVDIDQLAYAVADRVQKRSSR